MSPLRVSILLQCFLLFLVMMVSCGTSRNEEQQRGGEVTGARLQSQIPPTTIKQNLTLIGAVIAAIKTLDEYQYSLDIELRTAIPEGKFESLAEPGQRLTVIPQYRLDERYMIDLEDERNRRLMDVRSRRPGDFLFGKITLGHAGTWYLLDTELQ